MRKPASKAAVAKVEFIIPTASAEQIEASKQVYYGTYDCEFKQTVHISEDPKYSSYVDVTHGKASYLTSRELLTAATGRPLDPAIFKAHLKARYLP